MKKMSLENKVIETVSLDELKDKYIGTSDSIERQVYDAEMIGWKNGHQDGYLQALKDVDSGVVDINKLSQLIKKLEGDE